MMNQPVNFYQITRCTETNAFTAMLRYQSGNFAVKAKSKEIDSMKILADALYSHGVAVSEMDGFFLSVSFRFGKEFDLLKINDSACLNLELKSTLQNYSSEQAEEKIRSQLRKNKHYLSVLGRKLYLYTVVTDSMKCYRMSEDGGFKEICFSEIVSAVKHFFGAYLSDIESLFRPSEYLVSPLNHSRKFLEHIYFLTHDQEEKKKEILEKMRSNSVMFGLTGEAGTGKTLMLYDIARELAQDAPVLTIHCASEIPVGLSAIEHQIQNLKILRPKDFQNQDLSAVLNKYQYILTDETQRVYSGLMTQIYNYIRNKHKSAFICFDSRQTLSVQEENQNIAQWAYQHCDKIYTLKNTIRTNAEIMHFIRKLHNLNYHIPAQVQAELPEHVRICYAGNGLETDNFLDYYRLPGNGRYQFISLDSCNAVIGQEFDNVMLILDKIFYYDENQKLCAHNNQEFLYMHRLYQALTRARDRLVLIITDKNLFMQMISALGDELS
ncbi:MAG: DUF2075 domain-containing protein [Ruminococcus sp.]|nr:DUF2075 domain-containing protein [Ruminococcus sp.]